MYQKLSQLFQINWAVRVKNPASWIQILVAAAIAVLSYYGMNPEDLTSWSGVWNLIVQAFSNPYVVLMMIVSIVNITIDPTSSGVSDSAKAMNYSTPNSVKTAETATENVVVEETVAAEDQSDETDSNSGAVG